MKSSMSGLKLVSVDRGCFVGLGAQERFLCNTGQAKDKRKLQSGVKSC